MFFLPLFALGCYWAVLVYQLGAQWSLYDQYHYGWAVPFLCIYLFWQRWPSRPGAQPTPLSSKSGLLLGLLLFLLLPVRVLHEANPIWRLTSLGWALILVALTLGLLWRVGGWRWLRHFSPPIGFFLVAVPWPTPLETAVTQGLMRLNVGVTVEFLQFLGVPALQKGNVVELATGLLGIEEACSGIRSFQATLMIGLFFWILHRLSLRRGVALVVGGAGLAFLFNVIRTSLLSWVAARQGIPAIAAWHDPAGVTILVGCFVSLWIFAQRLAKQQEAERTRVNAEALNAETLKSEALPTATPRAGLDCFSGFQRFGFWLIAWLVVVEGGTELWYRLHERGATENANWSVVQPDDQGATKVLALPADIRRQFRSDQAIELHWRDAQAGDWQLYYFRWYPAHSVQARVAVQLAKTHGPEKCLPAAGMRLKSYLGIVTVPVKSMELAMQEYVFSAGGVPVNVFYGIYEDASGSTKLANRRKETAGRVVAALAGSRNYGQRFLELAVVGYESPEAARTALASELPRLLKVGR